MKCPHTECWKVNADVIDTQTVKGVSLRRLACLAECDKHVREDEKDCWVDDDGVETYPDDLRYAESEDDDADDDDED